MKTKVNEGSVDDFLAKSDETVRNECYQLIGLMEKVTGEKPKMWGTAIVGFGQYHYKYASGHEGDICRIGFSPRKGNLSLYVLSPTDEQAGLLSKLGKHKAGKGCLYIKKLDDVKLDVLEDLIKNTLRWLETQYPVGS